MKASLDKKKVMVAIFAHPDDEAFGPAGTIRKFTKTHDVYLLCATRGEVGKNSGRGYDLQATRTRELKASAKILGIKKVYFLGFSDGTLSNNLYHQLASKIEKHLRRLKPEIIMTDEPRGVSGHIDHIVVSMVTSFIFHKLSFIRELHQYCMLDMERKKFGHDYFIYFPDGYSKSQIDKVVDISDVWDIKVSAMSAHRSQRHDMERIIKNKDSMHKEEYFLVKRKLS